LKKDNSMADAILATKLRLSNDVTGLPRPELLRLSTISDTAVGVALPPASSPANVADNGRISFGAGFRLRAGR
jgi:hypothetical protein